MVCIWILHPCLTGESKCRTAQEKRTQDLKRLLVEIQEPIQEIARKVAQMNIYVEGKYHPAVHGPN